MVFVPVAGMSQDPSSVLSIICQFTVPLDSQPSPANSLSLLVSPPSAEAFRYRRLRDTVKLPHRRYTDLDQ